jgi:hypothetical protein
MERPDESRDTLEQPAVHSKRASVLRTLENEPFFTAAFDYITASLDAPAGFQVLEAGLRTRYANVIKATASECFFGSTNAAPSCNAATLAAIPVIDANTAAIPRSRGDNSRATMGTANQCDQGRQGFSRHHNRNIANENTMLGKEIMH